MAIESAEDKAQGTKLTQLRTELTDLDAEIILLADKEILDDAEEARWQELTVQREVVKAEHDKIEARAKMAEEIREKKFAEIRGVPNVILRDNTPKDLSRVEARVAVTHALRTLEDSDNAYRLTAAQTDAIERQIRDRHDLGDLAKRILATENDEYKSAWTKLLTNPNAGVFLTDAERVAMQRYEQYRAAPAGQSLTSGDGGYAVPVFIDPSVVLTNQETYNPFLAICDVEDINTTTWKGVASAGVSWSFDQEETEVSNDALTAIAQPSITARTARGFIPYSIEIGEDWPGFESEMGRLLGEGYNELLVSKFTNGAAASYEPDGIVTLTDASTGVEVVTTTDGQFGSEDIYAAWAALPQKHRGNASWLMSVSVMNKVRQFGTYNNSHAFTANLPVAAIDELFGKPVYENAYMPDYSSTTGKVNLLVVGNFRRMKIVRRRGMSVELVPHIFDTTTNLPSGQRAWYAYARIGSGVTDLGAFRLLQNQ